MQEKRAQIKATFDWRWSMYDNVKETHKKIKQKELKNKQNK